MTEGSPSETSSSASAIDQGEIIEIPRDVSAKAESADFDNPEKRAADLRNKDYEGDIDEKRAFARHAYRLAWTWLGFLIVVTWLQAVPDWFGFQLDEWAFRLIFTSVTAAVFGFAYLVGKYLFPAAGMKRD